MAVTSHAVTAVLRGHARQSYASISLHATLIRIDSSANESLIRIRAAVAERDPIDRQRRAHRRNQPAEMVHADSLVS